MTAAALCSHCFLPLGRGRHDAEVAGDNRNFCCYGCCLAFQVAHGENEESDAAWLLIRLGIGAFLSMNIMLFSLLLYSDKLDMAGENIRPVVHWALFLLATPTVLLLGGPFLRDACQEAARLRLGSSALVILGVGAAFLYSVLAMAAGGDRVYFDTATMVLVLFTLGRYLEAAGRARAMRSLAPMLAPEREWVTVLEEGIETRKAAREIHAGMSVLVRPGERIGVDGVIIEGASYVGEAVVTGESSPVAKHPGAIVLAGSINHDGPLVIMTQGDGTASRWMSIARSVREALGRRSRAEQLAERVAGAFVPAVLGLALATLIYWSERAPFGEALLHGLAVLVVACPCALGLAAPLATSIGIGSLARRGCIARGGDVLESLALTRVITFDKTGTLTLGEPRLRGMATDGLTPDEVLALAAALEARSEHPLAKGIRAEAETRGLPLLPVRNVQIVPGHGVSGEVDGVRVAAGSPAWLGKLGFAMPSSLALTAIRLENEAGSLIHVGLGSNIVGVLAMDDPLRPEARQVVAAIRKLRIEMLLLTGDRALSARRVASVLRIERVESSMTPEAKQSFLTRQGRRWAMVGDGLNDAPVLAAAGLGIAVGSATDLAREASGLVLPEGGLAMLPTAIGLSRAVRRTMIANLLWAFAYNAAALALAASGHLLPVLAAALMAGSSLVVVLNSLRLERFPMDLPLVVPCAAAALPESMLTDPVS
jgi:Cu2+-exporting ATPase